MKKSKREIFIEKLRTWLNSTEGKASLQRAAKEAQKECEKMRKRLEVSDEQYYKRVTI